VRNTSFAKGCDCTKCQIRRLGIENREKVKIGPNCWHKDQFELYVVVEEEREERSKLEIYLPRLS
jgi:hypothetical protein